MGERDWPQARGIYHNDAKSALVWVNEEDHLRIISMQKGKNIRQVFDRFANLVKAVEAACKEVGRSLEIDPMYGNILSCPSNCGTGLRASMMIKIPLASKQDTFKKWCADRKLQARGSGGFASAAKDDGIRDVSNVDRMGKDEVQLVNEMIDGVTALIQWEKELDGSAPASAPAAPSGSYTLYYHGAMQKFLGRGWSPLLILEEAGVPHSCKNAEEKPTGTFAVPVVELPNGQQVGQTAIICITLGKELGLWPSEDAKAIQYCFDAA